MNLSPPQSDSVAKRRHGPSAAMCRLAIFYGRVASGPGPGEHLRRFKITAAIRCPYTIHRPWPAGRGSAERVLSPDVLPVNAVTDFKNSTLTATLVSIRKSGT